MRMSVGVKIGPYEVIELLGAGGMGEVYKARDTRLDRVVALKILLAERTQDEERTRRFIQEAKAASALNHPHIVTIYDIGHDDGVDYLAMELVSGKSLDHLIPPNGLSLSEILRYGVQIADALESAHAAGIVHRDLKPANVMVTADGRVKLVDFGLAKLTRNGGEESDSSTATLDGVTREGHGHRGTAAYLSPEQAAAKPVDGRSDLFSLGAMLYEMATGQRAFRGDSQMGTISAVLRDDPQSVSEVSPQLPQELGRIISRCLRKDPAKRFQHAADLKVALEELKDESGSSKPAVLFVPKRSWRRWAWVVAAVLVGSALAGYFVARNAGGHAANMPFAGRIPTERMLAPAPLTSYPGDQISPSFSPDGNQVVFAWNGDKEDNFDIYVKLIGPGPPLRLTTDPARDFRPKWSPDGRSIAFLRELAGNRFAIVVVPPLGGPERKIAELYSQVRIRMLASLCWTRDSKSLIVSAAPGVDGANRLLLVSLDTGDVKTLTTPPEHEADLDPAVSPDGFTLAFRRFNGSVGRLLTGALTADYLLKGDLAELPAGNAISSLAWTADGSEILFGAGASRTLQTLYRIAAPGGSAPVPLTEAGREVGSPAVALHGNRLVYEHFFQDTNIWAVSFDEGKRRLEKRVPSSVQEVFPQYSPDGKKLAFHSDRGGTVQIWTCSRDSSGCVQLTSMAGATQGSPRWSPDLPGRSRFPSIRMKLPAITSIPSMRTAASRAR